MEVSQCSSWTSCSCPSLLRSPWRLHRCRFLDRFSCRCVWWRWPDNAEYCGESTVAVLGQGVHARLLRLVPMARQRGNCGDSTAAVLGQGVHACCCWSLAHGGSPAVAVLRSRFLSCRRDRSPWSSCPEDHRLRSCNMFPVQLLDKELPARCCGSRGASTGAEFSRQFFRPRALTGVSARGLWG